MTDAVWIAAIAALPATLGTISSLLNGRKINNVHEAVNGGLSAVKAELAAAKAEIKVLEHALALTQGKV